MGSVAKHSTPQLTPFAEPAALRALLNGSALPIRAADFHGPRHTRQIVLVAVVAVLPAQSEKRRRTHSTVREQANVARENRKRAEFFRSFDASILRLKTGHGERDLTFGDVEVTFSTMEVVRNGESVVLTALEFKTLKYLAQNPRRVISRDEFLNEVWGYENYPCTRTVDNHILKLRQKLEKHPSRPVHFRTVHRIGYKFMP